MSESSYSTHAGLHDVTQRHPTTKYSGEIFECLRNVVNVYRCPVFAHRMCYINLVPWLLCGFPPRLLSLVSHDGRRGEGGRSGGPEPSATHKTMFWSLGRTDRSTGPLPVFWSPNWSPGRQSSLWEPDIISANNGLVKRHLLSPESRYPCVT